MNPLESCPFPAIPDGLTPDDTMSLLAGRIVRTEAEVEHVLHMVFEELTVSKITRVLVPPMLAPLIKSVRAMLAVSGLDAEYVQDCRDALEMLNTVHLTRNRIVHDFWVQSDVHPPTAFVRSAKGYVHVEQPETVWDLQEFIDCYADLCLATARVGAITWSLPAIRDPNHMWASMLPSNRETIAGRIKMTGAHAYEFTDTNFSDALRADMTASGEELRRTIELAVGRAEDE
jgi:hypothetical protein